MTTSQVTYDRDWKEKYHSTILSADQAVARIKPGQRIFIGTGCAEPLELVRALTRRAYELPDTEIIHLLTFGEAPYAHRELAQYFRTNSFFIAENVRGIIQEGLGDYTPIHLSDVPRLFSSGQLPLDAALIQVSPPDAQGMVSLGVSVDIVKTAAENASLVIAQVNSRMPRTHGDSFLHVHELDWLVPVEEDLIEIPEPPVDEDTRQIGENLAALIEDGSTLELGIGRIPQALMGFLKGKRDLGIHTEMISDGIVDLIQVGAVTGSRKTLDKGKVVTSFCLGTRKLYDFIDDNPTFAFHPTEYVNSPFVISEQHKMVAINVALEIDLTGQVCADSIGAKFFSGVGGQVDFNRGASKARGGKAIIAIPSTAQGGTISRIVTHLSPGAGVVTTRAGVNYVVTEYGVAYLHGKSIQERAMALICIAHPKYRAQLLREAIEARYLSAELAEKEGKLVVGPKELRTTHLLYDGTQILFRPIHPTDEPAMRDLFYTLSEQSKFYRFMGHLKRVPRSQIEDFIYIDHRSEVTIVGVLHEAHGEDIIAVGSYYLDPKTNKAEVAFTVTDKWQRHGIGTFMLKHLARIARRNGISGFTAEVLSENRGMRTVFDHSEFKVASKYRGDVYSYELDFE
ncbi:MAG: GNAT family N-acetyltransferase [Verrucomicrobia bacterium]|jgi:acyl-CoA hydrolase/GNAT superfamily N-acetyltransferase|nr:GNAT family N-acetyltransferase [Verrucomicrobiota bacterium]